MAAICGSVTAGCASVEGGAGAAACVSGAASADACASSPAESPQAASTRTAAAAMIRFIDPPGVLRWSSRVHWRYPTYIPPISQILYCVNRQTRFDAVDSAPGEL